MDMICTAMEFLGIGHNVEMTSLEARKGNISIISIGSPNRRDVLADLALA